ncbi:histidinol-phosphatase (PHP family) [Desulfonispora thiosulfatigenes DSM 11270]|uniref:Histidinol-phosphatase n=1 Tax=Desulfonispora thiosulfatigenes DSM 11270 TaxID=656914 RepID=A0A1W1UQM8_DESTI|nr:histidinol-phosphatase HisJ family protein [Desulfonispora thiosulfatigenes]SMB83435.1 histidinol-phosphatase (PHP family) [Desulfonispora thiosulfatigenes DSM 11270]
MKVLIDQHVHTDFSPDSNTSMENMVKRAIELGLKEITFTDHVDYDYPDIDGVLFEVNYDKYMEEMAKLKNRYPEIEILMGVEVGYQPHLNERIDKLIKSYPFDFVIGSIHICDGLDLYTGDFFKGKTQKGSYLRYLENVKNCVQNFDNCDIFGHLDVIIRYGDFKNKDLRYEEFQESIDEILKLVIKKDKGIELNTSGIRYNLADMHPQKGILEKYHDLGGKILTLGSDAHNTRDLCAGFKNATQELKNIGFTKVTKFKARKPSFISI